MNTAKFHLTLLRAGVFLTLVMAVYHFYLPYQFRWDPAFIDGSNAEWSTRYSLNNYFSFLLIILGGTLGYEVFYKQRAEGGSQPLTFVLALFWVVSAIYQIIDPMKFPAQSGNLGLILTTFAFVNAAIFVIPLVGRKVG